MRSYADWVYTTMFGYPLPGHGVTVSTRGSNPLSLCSNQSAPAIAAPPPGGQSDQERIGGDFYIDDATGI